MVRDNFLYILVQSCSWAGFCCCHFMGGWKGKRFMKVWWMATPNIWYCYRVGMLHLWVSLLSQSSGRLFSWKRTMHLVPFVGVVISVCLCFTLENFWNIYIFFFFGWGGEWVSLYGSLIRSSNSLVLIGAYYAWEVENRWPYLSTLPINNGALAQTIQSRQDELGTGQEYMWNADHLL